MNISSATPDSIVGASSQFDLIDYFVLIILLVVSLGIGTYFGYFDKNEKTLVEYLLGGRRMKSLPIALSLIASQISAVGLISFPAEVYAFGFDYVLMFVPLKFLFIFIMNYTIVPVFFNSKVENTFDYLARRFDDKTRNLLTITFFITILLVFPMGSYVPALAFSQVSGWNTHIVNVVVTGICVSYTMMGGVKAVVWTDVFQSIVMVGVIATIFVLSLVDVGGFGKVIHTAIESKRIGGIDFTFDLITRQTFWNLMLGGMCKWLSYFSFNQICVQRLIALPSVGEARRAISYYSIGSMFLFIVNCFMGLIIFAYYSGCDPIKAGQVRSPEKLVTVFINDVVGGIPGMCGLFISCIFSASLSTVSAQLNSVAGVLYNNYIRKIRGYTHTEKKGQIIMKFLIFLIGVYSVLGGFLMEKAGSLFQTLFTIVSISAGANAGIFTLGMFFPRATSQGAFYGGLISVILVGWLVIQGRILQSRGEFNYKPLDASVDDCELRNITSIMDGFKNSSGIHLLTPSAEIDNNTFSIYKISFHWYAFIGTIIVWMFGIPMSYIFGKNTVETMDPSLISPVAKFLLPKKMRLADIQQSMHKNNKRQAEDATQNEIEQLTARIQ